MSGWTAAPGADRSLWYISRFVSPPPDSRPEPHPRPSRAADSAAAPAGVPAAGRPARAGIDFRRYRKLRRFLFRTLLQAFWHDLLLSHRTLAWARSPPLPRWRRVARRYRGLAVEMGGVLIKLGQFLSARVDILPREVISELSDLQDTVPPVAFEAVIDRIEADFGRPADEVFAWIDAEAMGAASLAQVHRARLATDGGAGGREVVVKVLRPGIEVLVETDLAAVRLATRLLGRWKKLRRRVDLALLYDEFATTTRRELDLVLEGDNAERFAADFAADPKVRIPEVFREASSRHVLTLEDVAFLKIADLPALDAAGVDRAEVARVLYRTYMRQVFDHFFIHADPHPGNLFVEPLGPPPEGGGGRRFRLVFVDFGMVTTIPPRLRAALREYAIGLGTRDAARMVRAERAAGVILPGADLRRFEEVYEDLLERFWGVSIGELRDTAMAEAKYFFRRYRDLLFEMPIQVRVELLFVARAIGLLAGLATNLDPSFDPWAETIPFARRLAARELTKSPAEWAAELGKQARIAALLPERIERLAAHADRGDLGVEASFSRQALQRLDRLEAAGRRLVWAVIGGALVVAGATLYALQPGHPVVPWVLGAGALGCLRALWRPG